MGQFQSADSDLHRANLIINSVALEFGVMPFEPHPTRRRGSPHVVLARQVTLYLFHTVFQMNMSRVGRVFGRHPTTAKHACAVIEASREDPVLDARLRRLELFLRAAPRPVEAG